MSDQNTDTPSACQACNGRGNLGTFDAYEYANGKVMTFTQKCHACSGTGSVLVASVPASSTGDTNG